MRKVKESREQAIARADREASGRFVASMALQAAMTDTLTRLVTVRYDGWTVRAYTTGLERADGGYLVLRSDFPNQKPYVVAHYADAWLAEQRETGHYAAAERRTAEARIAEALRYAINQANTPVEAVTSCAG